MSIVAAQPGYFIIGLTKGDRPQVWRTPILAWVVRDDLACPVAMENLGADVVLCPDGQVILPDNERYSSEADWFREAMKRRSKIDAPSTERRLGP